MVSGGGPNEKDLIMAGLDTKRVRGESSNIDFRTVRDANSEPVACVYVQAVGPTAKSASSAFTTAPAFPAQFIPPSQYDDKSRYKFCMRRPAETAASFCGIRSVSAETSIV
jgi:hypothetical protein